MEFSVTRISGGLVAPSGPTPSGVLELSVIDRLPALRCNVPTLHVFKHGGPRAAKVIREALSKALIYYYPLAGRLQFSDQNGLQVVCSGDGVWFAEASADCTLDAVSYFDDATSIPYDKLLPQQENHDHGLDDPLVQMQVTQFGCNGFVVGLITSHSICDGVGAAQLVNAVGEMAKGAEQPSITPEWGRNLLVDDHPNPNPSDRLIIPNIGDYQVEHATIDLSLDKMKELKQEFQNWSKTYCSTFEMVAAILWRERTRAIFKLVVQEDVKLVFYANCRHLIPQLPKGFYGNCFFPVSVTVPSGTLTNMLVFQVVKLIQEAKAGLADKFWKWLTKKNKEDPFEQALEYSTVFITEWDRLGFKEVDYGWGKPVSIVPIQQTTATNIIPVAILCSPTPEKRRLRLMTWCVQQHHLQPLLQNINVTMLMNKYKHPN